MSDNISLAGLLDRAHTVFSLSHNLSSKFSEEKRHQQSIYRIDPESRERHLPMFNQFCTSLLELREVLEHPPSGFDPVAKVLTQAVSIAKEIQEVMKHQDYRMWVKYLDYSGVLYSVSVAGRQAIEQVTKSLRPSDPLEFVDLASNGTGKSIDTTPTIPKPPIEFIESAARIVPVILADVSPRYDGKIEIVASHLVEKLRDAKHTVAAAQWAIHELVLLGRLQTGLVETAFPSAGVRNLGSSGLQWHGGQRGTIVIPKNKPTPFESFTVFATESLWEWWRSGCPTEMLPESNRVVPIEVSEKLSIGPNKEETNASGTLSVKPYSEELDSKEQSAEKKRKRSTSRGEARTKLLAALTLHHQYDNGSCLNLVPVGNNELAQMAKVSPSSASRFFDELFKGHSIYRVACQNPRELAASLKLLNGEYCPYEILGSEPSDNRDSDY